MTKKSPAQLDLFGAAAEPAGPAVAPAPVDDRVVRLGARLDPLIRLGTSSWSFPGWVGLVYRDKHSDAVLARSGLGAYAHHPLFRSVGIDRTHYGPIGAEQFAEYAAAVPNGFRFLTKAHEACTLHTWPKHARYGKHRGEINERFFDPAYATDVVVAPFVEGLGETAGPLVFQVAPQPMANFGGPKGFAERLHRFLSALPRGPLYSVEVRNAKLITKQYAEALNDVGAAHCINVMPSMPSALDQWKLTERENTPALVARWMLAPHLQYESAVSTYEPFHELVDPDPVARRGLSHVVDLAQKKRVPSWIIVNNKAEGCAPESVIALASAIVGDSDVPF